MNRKIGNKVERYGAGGHRGLRNGKELQEAGRRGDFSAKVRYLNLVFLGLAM